MNVNARIKRYTILSLLLVAILLIAGTYAFFTYSRTGVKKNQILAGNVWLKFSETGNTVAINSKAFPESAESAREIGRTDNILNFTIEGLNDTTNKDIYYEIKLLYGPDNEEGRVRIADKYLKFDLEETVNGVTTRVLDSVSYDSINNTRIYVNTVKSGETVSRSYTLRVWISDELLISNTNPNASYTSEAYRNLYSNVKVMVYGDFNAK